MRIIGLMSLVLSVFPQRVYAASLGTIGKGEGLGPFSAGKGGTPGENFEQVISTVIGLMTIGGMLWFMAQLFIGALGWVSAGGDPKRLETARHRITNAVIGLIIVVAAWAIIGVIGTILGLDILNPAGIIRRLPLGGESLININH